MALVSQAGFLGSGDGLETGGQITHGQGLNAVLGNDRQRFSDDAFAGELAGAILIIVGRFEPEGTCPPAGYERAGRGRCWCTGYDPLALLHTRLDPDSSTYPSTDHGNRLLNVLWPGREMLDQPPSMDRDQRDRCWCDTPTVPTSRRGARAAKFTNSVMAPYLREMTGQPDGHQSARPASVGLTPRITSSWAPHRDPAVTPA
jgi:hypothetical protein